MANRRLHQSIKITPKYILIVHQDELSRPNASEVALCMAPEEKGHNVATLFFQPENCKLMRSNDDAFLEADGCEINVSEVPLFYQDTKFMDLIYKRMKHPKHGMKVEKRRDEIYIIYPAICERVSKFDGSVLMTWADGEEEAIDFMEKLEKYGIMPTDSIESLRKSRSKITSQRLFEANGVPTPKTLCFPNNPDNKYGNFAIRDELIKLGPPPWYIKSEYGVGGDSVWRVKDEIEVIDIVNLLREKGEGFVIQEEIPSLTKNRPQRIRIVVQDGKIVGALRWTGAEGAITDNAYFHKHGTNRIIQKSVPMSCLEELTEAQKDVAIRAVEAVGLSTSGVDLLGTPDRPLVLEANNAPGLWFHKSVGQNTFEEVAESMISRIKHKQPKIS